MLGFQDNHGSKNLCHIHPNTQKNLNNDEWKDMTAIKNAIDYDISQVASRKWKHLLNIW
jgi:hypothetical protein